MTKSSTSVWHLLHNVKLMVKISSIFVAFLENMNFTWWVGWKKWNFFQSTHQVDMKIGVKCYKDFSCYFNALKTNCVERRLLISMVADFLFWCTKLFFSLLWNCNHDYYFGYSIRKIFGYQFQPRCYWMLVIRLIKRSK